LKIKYKQNICIVINALRTIIIFFNNYGVNMAKEPLKFKKIHKSVKGGLTEAGRKYAKTKGYNLKRPQPEGGPRRNSFCARMGGMKKDHNIDCKKDPKKRICKALKRWNC
jgi:hypothetical protein